MRILFTSAPGTNLESKSLPNGQMIRGIEIDNPSGNWLYVVSEQTFCPPYTIGWAMPLSYDQSSITVQALLVGPASQIGTNQGDPWQLVLHDEEVSPSSGVPYQFVENYVPSVLWGGATPTITNSSPLVFDQTTPGVANKRIRLLTVQCSIQNPDAQGNTLAEILLSEIRYSPAPAWTGRGMSIWIGGPYPNFWYQVFPIGTMDLSLGSGFGITVANMPWSNTSAPRGPSAQLFISWDYQLI